MAMPRGMFRHELPRLPEPEACARFPAVVELFASLHEAASRWTPGRSRVFEMSGFDAGAWDLINQILGEGEVSVTVSLPDGDRLLIQESVFTGVWRVRRRNGDGLGTGEFLEVADIPQVVREETFTGDDQVDTSPDGLPDGVQNAPALLVEIAEAVRDHRPGDPAHVVNLTLLPVTPADLIALGMRLGVGPTTILSRGYGNCRIGATAKDGVWWLKYYNSQDALILNTIEVVAVPEVALAAREDFEDSARRLGEIVEMLG